MEQQTLANKNLPQLYRFCFLMLGDAAKALDVFQAIMHDASLRAAQGELPKDKLWLFRDARFRCLEVSEKGLQPEDVDVEEHSINPAAPKQIGKLEPAQLAIWIAGAPDPQRSALALFYLDLFDHEELLALTELKTAEVGRLIGNARQEFQAWLDSTVPLEDNAT